MLAYLESLDHQLFFALNNGLASPWLDWLFWGVSVVGDGVPLTILVGLALWCYDRPAFRAHYLWIVLAVVAGSLAVHLLKQSINRPRPLAHFAPQLRNGVLTIHTLGSPLLQRSFPSGHAQAAAAISAYLSGLYPHHVCWWVVLLFMVDLSRIYLGVHFPADVLCGSLLGALLSWGIFTLRRTSLPQSSSPPNV